MNAFDRRIYQSAGQELRGAGIDTIQVNVGLVCNQECVHCHVASSPRRKESMDWETMTLIVNAANQVHCRLVDITGGAPELNPHFRAFVETLRSNGFFVQVRTNLTVLLEPEMRDLPEFCQRHQVHLVASLPCYLAENVDRQRGPGVYAKSIAALRRLNAIGYGADPNLPLNLVYNPIGPILPPNQETLQEAYRRELHQRFGIVFTHLLTITNMPIGRFRADLRHQNREAEYMRLLRDSFNPATMDGLMCRRQININWDGVIYDCDFNLALRKPVGYGAPSHIRDFDAEKLAHRRIITGEHCFGCTAGCGSSCSGALAASV
ncbi:MAG: arsenosugar biosynthesis radical SAM (seleno)protein ArsS [bacterium]